MKKSPDIHAVIMAGGIGTRFWPLSRKRTPKQFLPIVGDMTMIEETVQRILPLVPPRKIFTIANSVQTRTIRRLLPKVPGKNLLIEPKGKNTAPSILLATAWIYLKNPDAVVAVLPSDHLITNTPAFLKKMEAAAAVAAGKDTLITFGIPPAFPSTGYGYIHFQKKIAARQSGEFFYKVEAFKEKPSYKTAVKFLKAGHYYWNSGMFVWRAGVFARMLERFAPDFYPFWLNMLEALDAGSKIKLNALFEKIPAISIDYALMEKACSVLVCEGDFGWSDVGAWSSLFDIWEKDEAGNAVKGESVIVDSHNTLCYSPGKLTALIGVKDLIVVDAKNALLVCRRDQDQRVKELLEILDKRNKTKYL